MRDCQRYFVVNEPFPLTEAGSATHTKGPSDEITMPRKPASMTSRKMTRAYRDVVDADAVRDFVGS